MVHTIDRVSRLTALCFLLCTGPALAAAPATEPGDFNAALFGTVSVIETAQAEPRYTPQLTDESKSTAIRLAPGGSIQIEWRQPRDIHVVRLVFAGAVPTADSVELAYWYHIWPDNGGGGWMKLDDPFNGRFVTAAVEPTTAGGDTLSLRLRPLDSTENAKAKETGFTYRRTYKVKITFRAAAEVAEAECLTDSRWKDAAVRVELGRPNDRLKFEACNARIISTERIDPATRALTLRYADNPQRRSADRGHVIVRQDGQGADFSFFVDDVLREGIVFVRDIDAYVSDGAKKLSRSSWQRPADAWDATVMEKVASMPEQSLERAATDIPPKWIPVAHMGLPNLRQEISIDDRSQIYTDYRSMRSPGQDRDRSPNLSEDRPTRTYVRITRKKPFEPPGPKRIKRWLEEGYLPIIHSQWEDDGFSYHQTIFVTTLDPAQLAKVLANPTPAGTPIGSGTHAADFGTGPTGDEAVVAMCRLEIENPAATAQTATMWLKIGERPPMNIGPDGLLVLNAPTRPRAATDLTPTWGQIDVGGKGELKYLKDFIPPQADPAARRDIIQYTISLEPHARHTIVMKVPHLEQLTPVELAQLRERDWSASCQDVARLWKQRLAAAVENYQVPDTALMNLYRANLWHVLIGTDRDPPTGLYQHGAGTYDYPNYPNEAMMVARSLEMRGEHEEARRIIEPCLISQGTRALPGNFKGKEGLLYAAAPLGYDHYTAQGYNMHHGFILWAAAEHYMWTRDKQYLEAIAPRLVAACDWITRERKATMITDPDGRRPLEYGLAPAGDLEDVDEYLYWYATNAYYYLGMKTAGDILSEMGHPDAQRIAVDTAAYAADIMTSVRESAARSPVVRLFDGSYLPYVPSRAYVLTDRSEGWIREALYCSLHLLDAGLVRPDDPLVTWILNTLEDRIFMSEESGYGPDDRLTDPKTQFFSWGGFNPQPNLLDNSIAYLKRGQIPNFLRAFFNTYGISIYPDIQCFAEACSFGMGGGPLYKTPDESKFIQWMHQMLVFEMDGNLHIGRGVPRAWMTDGKKVVLKNAATYFGPIDFEITSAAGRGELIAEISLPSRNPAHSAHVSLRHPEGRKIRSVKMNGQNWSTFDAAKDTVTVPGAAGRVRIVAEY